MLYILFTQIILLLNQNLSTFGIKATTKYEMLKTVECTLECSEI